MVKLPFAGRDPVVRTCAGAAISLACFLIVIAVVAKTLPWLLKVHITNPWLMPWFVAALSFGLWMQRRKRRRQRTVNDPKLRIT